MTGNVTVRWYTDDGYKYRDTDCEDLVCQSENDTNILGNLIDVLHDKGLLVNGDLNQVFGYKYEFVEN